MNDDVYHRKSLRLPGFDYSTGGAYFVTVCINDRAPLLGEIRNTEMEPSIAGQMVESWWNAIPMKFPSVELDAYVVMPNHMHGIVVLHPNGVDDEQGKHGGLPLQVGVEQIRQPSLPRVIQWFKSITTTDYIRGVHKFDFPGFDRRFWQANYYEHIIRTETALNRIRQYINSNIANWHSDPENPAV